MKVTPTAIADVLVIEPKVFGDARGFFYESFNQKAFNDATGLNLNFVQDNHSRSAKGVLRGLHYQIQQPQGKLVRVARGAVWDVAVDLRAGSSTFLHWHAQELSARNHTALLIPPGFAHGFQVLEEGAELLYLHSAPYTPACEGALNVRDPRLAIAWPLPVQGLSARDAAHPLIGADFEGIVL